MAHGDIAGTYDLEMKIGDVPVTVRAVIFPSLTTAMVLGIDFLHANAITVDIPRRVLLWNRPASRTIVAESVVPSPVSCPSVKTPCIRRAPKDSTVDPIITDVCFQMDIPCESKPCRPFYSFFSL